MREILLHRDLFCCFLVPLQSVIFDEIDLTDLTVVESCSKNVSYSFQCITPFRSLMLAADTQQDLEEWVAALKSAKATSQFYEGVDQIHSLLSGKHNWYATSHARPTYCNVCREALSGVTSHGLSCEVCKMKAHKRCAAKALNNCKWTTLASVGKDIIEDDEGNLAMPHQWLEGNLPVSAKCAVCDKTCGSVLRLQDWRCLWCRAMVHTACRPLHSPRCPLGLCKVSIVPPTALTTIGTDETWEVTRPQNCSPLLVFVNSKSGDNQGVRFLRRFKQLLNPAQVFDLMNGGPLLGLRLFKCFNPFRILICSGDGSVGWVLTEIDKLHMTNQCQVGVLPLGTGNDLARVLGWGSACDDDAHLPHILERYERATTKILDRWSIMSYVSAVSLSPQHKLNPLTSPSLLSQVAAIEDSVGAHLATLLQSEKHSVVISSAKVLCETIKSLIMKVGKSWSEASGEGNSADAGGVDDSLSAKCEILNDKLDLLLRALHEESIASMSSASTNTQESSGVDESPETSLDFDGEEKGVSYKEEKPSSTHHRKRHKRKHFIEKDALMSRANSLKKAVREIIEHTEKALDDQNEQTAARKPPPTIKLHSSEEDGAKDNEQDTTASSESSPTPGKGLSPFLSSITTNFPLPPATPMPLNVAMHVPGVSFSEGQHHHHHSPGGTSPPRTPNVDDPLEQLRAKYECISPLPDLRRESQIEFEFPPTIPVPREFADSRKNSMVDRKNSLAERKSSLAECVRKNSIQEWSRKGSIQESSRKNSIQEGRGIPEGSGIGFEDIEVRINSSTDNLVEVGGDEEPYEFEEKSISKIRDSLASSLNTSVDIDEDIEEVKEDEEMEESAREIENDKIQEEKGEEDAGEEDEREKTEMGDSDETDDTVRETQRSESKEGGQFEDTTPEGDASVTEETSVNSTSDIEGKKETCETEESIEDAKTSPEESHQEMKTPTVPLAEEELLGNLDEEEEIVPPSSERYVEGAEAGTDDEIEEEEKGEDSTRRISTGSTYKPPAADISTLSVASSTSGKDKSKSSDVGGHGVQSRKQRRASTAAGRRHLPIINPLVSLPMWPSIAAGAGSGGLISKVLLANADALCAAASPLMDLDDSCLDGYEERCTMNNYFGIGIDAKITLDFHNKREEHPEKCRSRTKNFMWYGVLASKEWLCKTYKNLDQRVQLECDGERIPLPSLQGIVVLNIPSFMGGTNFWGGTKEDDCFLAPSFDDRILEVVAVFGSAQMAASRIINLQHHRIAQCSTIKITILGEAGEEGVPIQVDGEAWTQPPGIVRIVHKNRVQMLCRNRDLEVSLKAWEEKQRSSGNQTKQPTLLADEELPILAALASTVGEVISSVHLAAINTPKLETHLGDLASSGTVCLEKIWRDGRVIESPNLRMLATELVTNMRSLHLEITAMLNDDSPAMIQTMTESLQGALAQLDGALKHVHEKDNLMHFYSEEEGERKPIHSKGLFKIKLKRDGRKGGLEREVKDWGPDEVAAWLDGLHLTEYRESFIRHDIRGSELLNLERRDLKELGITKIGHIKRIQQGIREIKDSKSHT